MPIILKGHDNASCSMSTALFPIASVAEHPVHLFASALNSLESDNSSPMSTSLTRKVDVRLYLCGVSTRFSDNTSTLDKKLRQSSSCISACLAARPADPACRCPDGAQPMEALTELIH
mmetsp:Transcript_21660/g.42540  ORF Transcript_21660/g.42540 Transcript_21660/m.42540 type:complete len:118 (+) Transcript_21660:1389-1742(+)